MHWEEEERRGEEGLETGTRLGSGAIVWGLGPVSRGGRRGVGGGRVTCCRAMLHTQRCQPPSEPLELRQRVQSRSWSQGTGQGRGGEDSTCMGDTLRRA